MGKIVKQTTNTILMIEPVSFGFNDQTAVNNYFQQKDGSSDSDIQSRALAEFNLMVEMLRTKGLIIIVVQDTSEPHTPDSIFPNNWISFHQDGRVALYPMYAENRRAERRNDILQLFVDKGFEILEIADYTVFEKQNRFLEGTGSMIFDHMNKIAYAALSERTDKKLFLQFCNDFDFKPVYFLANQTADGKRRPIYHTNVMMCVGDQYSVVCPDAIDNVDERHKVMNSLVESGKEIIEISEEQMHHFAGNMLQVENKGGTRFLVMSQSAFDTLTARQMERLNTYNEIIAVAIPTIERYGGGSVRCMMAEVFNAIV
jgi:hypothetical protein